MAGSGLAMRRPATDSGPGFRFEIAPVVSEGKNAAEFASIQAVRLPAESTILIASPVWLMPMRSSTAGTSTELSQPEMATPEGGGGTKLRPTATRFCAYSCRKKMSLTLRSGLTRPMKKSLFGGLFDVSSPIDHLRKSPVLSALFQNTTSGCAVETLLAVWPMMSTEPRVRMMPFACTWASATPAVSTQSVRSAFCPVTALSVSGMVLAALPPVACTVLTVVALGPVTRFEPAACANDEPTSATAAAPPSAATTPPREIVEVAPLPGATVVPAMSSLVRVMASLFSARRSFLELPWMVYVPLQVSVHSVVDSGAKNQWATGVRLV